MPKARQTRRCPGCGQDIYFNIHDQGYICVRDRVKWVNGNTWTIVHGRLKSEGVG